MRVTRTGIAVIAGIIGLAALSVVMLDENGHRGVRAAGAAEGPPRPALPVPVVAVLKQAVPINLDYVGTAEAIRMVVLQAKVTGYLATQAAPDGADVKAGDLLYRIDPRDYQAALDQVKAQAARDAAAHDYSRANQHRNEVLNQEGWVAHDSYDQSTSTLHQTAATLTADQAAIQQAELNLGYTEIRAPFAGRLSRSQVHEGALITAATTQLNTLVQLNPIYATFNPGETDLAKIEKYRAAGLLAVEVTVPGTKMPPLKGTLTFVDNAIDRTTGTITARATIDNPDRLLLPGQYVHVQVHLTDRPDALLLPQVAIGSSQLGKYVYVVGDGNKAEQRFVTLGETVGELVVVESGVKEDESVIVGNLQKLGPGAPVAPHPAPHQSGS